MKYSGVTVTAEFTGSSAGVEAVLAGSCDLGNSSRNLKDEEKTNGAVENIVAIDGIAVVVDPANAVTGLTKEQLAGIYTGEITNWSDVGGEEAPVVVGREAGSGTRGAFEEILEIENLCAYANELDSTGAVMANVASTPGAIGYVSQDVVDDTYWADCGRISSAVVYGRQWIFSSQDRIGVIEQGAGIRRNLDHTALFQYAKGRI